MSKSTYRNKYPVRYKNPHSDIILNESFYLKDGKKISGKVEYLFQGKWISALLLPEKRHMVKKYRSSKQGYFLAMKNKMHIKSLERKRKGKCTGENEFEEGWGKCNKLVAQFDEQVERYGNRCPITLIPFTMIRKITIAGRGERISSNISPDRFFNNISYTKQNLLFTSGAWNFKKGDSDLKELEFFFPHFIDWYKKIFIERFPDQKYAL